MSESHQKVIGRLTVFFGEAHDADGGKAFLRKGCGDVVGGEKVGTFSITSRTWR